MNSLKLSDFSFEVPAHLVAQTPLRNRDDSKLLIRHENSLEHSSIKRLADAVPEGSLFIVNNSRVIASRIRFTLRGGGQAELLLLEPLEAQLGDSKETWRALGRPLKRLKAGCRFDLGNGLSCEVTRNKQTGEGSSPIDVMFSLRGEALQKWLDDYGEMPLPPYIERRGADEAAKSLDRTRYQTIYSEPAGSVAAPTAGLHFTPEVMASLREKNCEVASVTLHVGAGTFLPVKTAKIQDHIMHSERFMVPRATIEAIERAKSTGRKVIAVGTTALRSLEGLESLAKHQQKTKLDLTDCWLRTEIFIHPQTVNDRYKPWAIDALMTNFHQPESTLFMLVSALIGINQARELYAEAVESNYRFFSYGDSSLLWL